MNPRRSRTEYPHPAELPPAHTLLETTDWASLATPCGTGESLPAALMRLTDPDPVVRESALPDALGAVTHQNSIYEATVPVALYVAAILDHPAIATDRSRHDGETPRTGPTLVRLLDWLGDTARDADDECVALGGGDRVEDFLDECEEMRAFRDARPAIFSAVRTLLGHDRADVRHAALVAAIPLIEHPHLIEYRADLADHARSLLATSTDRRHRDRVFDGLRAWGHDTSGLENASDIAAREHYARLRAARASWGAGWTGGGYSEDPPF
ncbi:hypothetical protein [Streptomyces virginiae]|uniref:hypothetical protein n=1 Tax=Streptomyces virginiae TaxID=1961 RepID=UPI00224FA949|nr:hypothetical protein [Streptomyces virginiae]MCX5175418.1 hypothetical protein [Streptomyces virginiae]